MNATDLLPMPTSALVAEECRQFDSDHWTKLCEESMRQLYQQFPENELVSHVLLKTMTLNTLYSTRVNYVDLVPLAEHITRLRIDGLLKAGDLSAVRRIFRCEGMRDYYSFATKYCSWHNPCAYPIYDRYVDEALWAYRKRGWVDAFKRQDLSYYDRFVGIVSAFRSRYGLDVVTFRNVDKFLWRTGERLVREKEGNAQQPTINSST
jgi:hypothetical protein